MPFGSERKHRWHLCLIRKRARLCQSCSRETISCVTAGRGETFNRDTSTSHKLLQTTARPVRRDQEQVSTTGCEWTRQVNALAAICCVPGDRSQHFSDLNGHRHILFPKACGKLGNPGACIAYNSASLKRWHDFSHRRAAAGDGLCISELLASVGRGSNHDSHEADISLASRCQISSARRCQRDRLAFHFRLISCVMITGVGLDLLGFPSLRLCKYL